MLQTKHEEKVNLDLNKKTTEPSTASVVIGVDSNDSIADWASTTTDFFVNANKEDQTVWVNIRQHAYIQVGDSAPLSVINDLISKHLTRAEAEALLATLANELGKLD